MTPLSMAERQAIRARALRAEDDLIGVAAETVVMVDVPALLDTCDALEALLLRARAYCDDLEGLAGVGLIVMDGEEDEDVRYNALLALIADINAALGTEAPDAR